MFTLADLPYPKDALKPVLSKETLEFHHDKHHQTYIDNLNKLIEDTEFKKLQLEEIIKKASGAIFNNAAQAWNHSFYWHSLTPEKLKGPKGALLRAIEKDFGSLTEFENKFLAAANGAFGSSWAWLVKRGQELKIEVTANADNPLRTGGVPLFTCDLWEHAYYIDYRNARAKYISEFMKILNWDFAESAYTKA